jgi:hypothetical protein
MNCTRRGFFTVVLFGAAAVLKPPAPSVFHFVDAHEQHIALVTAALVDLFNLHDRAAIREMNTRVERLTAFLEDSRITGPARAESV